MHPLIEQLEDMGVDVELALETRFMDDEDTYIECIFDFLGDPSMANLRAATAAHDIPAATRAVHTLKGLSDALGFLPLFDESVDMLGAFRAGDPEEAFAMLPRVSEVYDQFVNLIRPYQQA